MKIQIKMSGQNGFQFEVISTRTVEPPNLKKYVVSFNCSNSSIEITT